MPARQPGKRKIEQATNLPAHKSSEDPEHKDIDVPRSFIVSTGKVDKNIRLLVEDLRQVMRPNTSLNLKETRGNKLKDFTSVTSHFDVSHVVAISQTGNGCYMKIGRMPFGPTLTFRIKQYSLRSDVRASQRKPYPVSKEYQHAPLLVLNGFRSTEAQTAPIKKKRKSDSSKSEADNESAKQAGAPSIQNILSTALFSLFPSINVDEFEVEHCRRVCLFRSSDTDPYTNTISMRHYAVCRRMAGVSRGVKKLLRKSNNPSKVLDLSSSADVADLVLDDASGYASDSDIEDTTTVEVASRLSSEMVDRADKLRNSDVPGLVASTSRKVAIYLKELGPRIELELVKIEGEAFTGEVLFHRYIQKSEAELKNVAIRGSEAAAKRKKLNKKAEAEMQKREDLRMERKEKRKKKEEQKANKKTEEAAEEYAEEADDERMKEEE